MQRVKTIKQIIPNIHIGMSLSIDTLISSKNYNIISWALIHDEVLDIDRVVPMVADNSELVCVIDNLLITVDRLNIVSDNVLINASDDVKQVSNPDDQIFSITINEE